MVREATSIEDAYRARGAQIGGASSYTQATGRSRTTPWRRPSPKPIRRGPELSSPIAWVTRAAFRIAAGELKARRRIGYPITEEDGYEMPEPAFDLAAALSQLSPKQLAAAILHYRDGYTAPEIAEFIDSSASAVGVHLHRARKRLRELLGDDDASTSMSGSRAPT